MRVMIGWFLCLALVLGFPALSSNTIAMAADAAPAVEDEFEDDPFAEEETSVEIADPIEGINRGFFWVNDKLYFYALKPLARGWRVVPEPVRVSADNFLTNLLTPVRFTNNVLQGKAEGAVIEVGRLFINTIGGMGGLFDIATDMDLTTPEEDTGQTLGAWGAGHGFYIVLPVFGPSSLRDGVGRVGDSFLDPLTYVDMTYLEKAGVKVFDTVNYLSIDKDTYEAIKKDALDPYLFVRDGYVQRRAKAVKE